MTDHVRTIKERLLISEVIAEKVKLLRKGRALVGKCPFHNEKTPSFTVNDSKGSYHCFGCGAHGDIFDFIMQIEGLSFTEALSRLATRAGIAITSQVNYSSNYEILDAATKWAQKNINTAVLQYLKSRSITDESIGRFQVGYVPSHGLKAYLETQGYTMNAMIEVGLLSKGQKEYFYNRIIFPIHDSSGRIIAFGGRACDSKGPKYLNSPETDLFKKSETLYGWHLAKQEDVEEIIIVEGYLDVIALAQVGMKNVVAPLGTALTLFHLQHVCKLYKKVIVCFDGDEAGKNAILKTIKLVLATEYIDKLRFVVMPQNKDPCDVAMEDGFDVLKLLLQSSQSTSEMLWDLLSTGCNLDNPEEKVQLRNNLSKYTNDIKDFEIRRYYQNFFYKKLFYTKKTHKTHGSGYKLISTAQNLNFGEILLSIVLHYPDVINDVHAEEIFATFTMNNQDLLKVQDYIVTLMNEHRIEELSDSTIDKTIKKSIDRIMQRHPFQSKEQADEMWKRVILILEIQELEIEYNNTITNAINENQSDRKANDILQRLLALKALLNEV